MAAGSVPARVKDQRMASSSASDVYSCVVGEEGGWGEKGCEGDYGCPG